MTFANPKPAGYADGEKLTHTAVNQAWAQWPYALDGYSGGTYAPSAAIAVGGAGFNFTGLNHTVAAGSRLSVVGTGSFYVGDGVNAANMAVQDNALLTLYSGAQCNVNSGAIWNFMSGCNLEIACNPNLTGKLTAQSGGEIEVQSGATLDLQSGATCLFNANVSLSGKLTVSSVGEIEWAAGSVLDCKCPANFDSTVALNNKMTVGASGEIEFNAAAVLDVKCASEFSNTAHFTSAPEFSNGSTMVNGAHICTGTARVVKRAIIGEDVDRSYVIGDADLIVVANGGLSANRAWTLSTTGANNGDVIQVRTLDETWTLTVAGLAMKRSGGIPYSASWVYLTSVGNWVALDSIDT